MAARPRAPPAARHRLSTGFALQRRESRVKTAQRPPIALRSRISVDEDQNRGAAVQEVSLGRGVVAASERDLHLCAGHVRSEIDELVELGLHPPTLRRSEGRLARKIGCGGELAEDHVEASGIDKGVNEFLLRTPTRRLIVGKRSAMFQVRSNDRPPLRNRIGILERCVEVTASFRKPDPRVAVPRIERDELFRNADALPAQRDGFGRVAATRNGYGDSLVAVRELAEEVAGCERDACAPVKTSQPGERRFLAKHGVAIHRKRRVLVAGELRAVASQHDHDRQTQLVLECRLGQLGETVPQIKKFVEMRCSVVRPFLKKLDSCDSLQRLSEQCKGTPPVRFSSGQQKTASYNGSPANLSLPSGDLDSANPQSWFAAPFIIPPPPPPYTRWFITEVVGKGYVAEGNNSEGLPFVTDQLCWALWNRQPGNPAPAPNDLHLESGCVPMPMPHDVMGDAVAGSAFSIELENPLLVGDGTYYFTLYGANGGRQAPSNWSWFVYATEGVHLLNGQGQPFGWRSSSFPSPGFEMFTGFAPPQFQVASGDSPNAIYTPAFVVLGEPDRPVVILCPADFDADGSVGGGDLGVLLGAWGTASSGLDLDGDGVIGGGDLGIVLGAWGPCAG